MGACGSRTNVNDRLPLASLIRVQGGDSIVEGRDVADVHPQSSIAHPLDDLTQLGTIGLDSEVDRQAVGGPRLGRPDDGHQISGARYVVLDTGHYAPIQTPELYVRTVDEFLDAIRA